MNTPFGSRATIWTDHPVLASAIFRFEPNANPVEAREPAWWRRLDASAESRGFTSDHLLPGWSGPAAQGAFVARSGVSQYRVLRDLLAEGPDLDRPLVLVAGAGDNFEGQSGRSWLALEGNLHLSVALPCRLRAGPEALALTALPAVAVQRALAGLRPEGQGPPPGIKWANDVLLGDRKVAGVLTYARTRDGEINAVVYGIGVNVAAVPDLPPSTFSPGATSLVREWGSGGARLEEVCRQLLTEMVRGHGALHEEGPTRVVEAYREASSLTGHRVGIWPAETPDAVDPAAVPPLREGIVREIGPDLSLELEGQSEKVRSGRLAILA